MSDDEWVILDTETTGIVAPIHVVDLAAQRMKGWEPIGAPFQMYLDHGIDIPREAEAVHGLSRDFLSSNGKPPARVHADFTAYAGQRPLVSFNLPYDFDQALLPEWRRLDVAPLRRGFCALKLSQMLIGPSPAGNFRLQSLKAHYGLPDHKAHSALGDVQTVIDLLNVVLRPLAEGRGLSPYEALADFAVRDWFPERLTFGKFKGHDYREAATNSELRRWLEWLSKRPDAEAARMGSWYLSNL